MNEKRIDHACGVFVGDGKKKKVIVAGGVSAASMASNVRQVEVYDLEVHMSACYDRCNYSS
jgi:hypothetical protein